MHTLIDTSPEVVLSDPHEDLIETLLDVEGHLSEAVPDAAAFLDEHVPGWHKRVTKRLAMSSCASCVLGQIFGEPDAAEMEETGFFKGMVFLYNRNWRERPFVFSHNAAAKHWMAEIDRRST